MSHDRRLKYRYWVCSLNPCLIDRLIANDEIRLGVVRVVVIQFVTETDVNIFLFVFDCHHRLLQ